MVTIRIWRVHKAKIRAHSQMPLAAKGLVAMCEGPFESGQQTGGAGVAEYAWRPEATDSRGGVAPAATTLRELIRTSDQVWCWPGKPLRFSVPVC